MTHQKIAITPQFLPRRAWYFGGSYDLDVFCTIDDMEYLKQMPCGICLDTAHCIMAANHDGSSPGQWIKELLGIASHIHVADATGTDGEGIAFGQGLIHDTLPAVLSHDCVKIVEQWEGHLADFRGFEEALSFLEQHIK